MNMNKTKLFISLLAVTVFIGIILFQIQDFGFDQNAVRNFLILLALTLVPLCFFVAKSHDPIQINTTDAITEISPTKTFFIRLLSVVNACFAFRYMVNSGSEIFVRHRGMTFVPVELIAGVIAGINLIILITSINFIFRGQNKASRSQNMALYLSFLLTIMFLLYSTI